MRFGILTAIFFSIFFEVTCQDRITALLDSARSQQYVDYDLTELLVAKAERAIRAKNSANITTELLTCYAIRAETCQCFLKFQLWRQYLDAAANLFKEDRVGQSNENQLLWLKHKLSFAQYYNYIGESGRAYDHFVELYAEFSSFPEKNLRCEMQFIISMELGSIHDLEGEYEAAINQYLAAVKHLACHRPGSHTGGFYTIPYRNLARSYMSVEDFKHSRKYLRLAEKSLNQLLLEYPESSLSTAIPLYETIADYYKRQSQFDSARLILSKSIPLLSRRTVTPELKGRVYLGLGEIFRMEDQWKESFSHFDLAEAEFSRTAHTEILLASVSTARARALDELKRPQDAIAQCEKAIELLTTNPLTDKDARPIGRVLSRRHLFQALQLKSRSQEKLFLKTKDPLYLKEALTSNQLSLALMDSAMNTISLDQDKILLSEMSFGAFEDAIRLKNELRAITGKDSFDEIFSLIERSKGLLLVQNLRVVNQFSGVSGDWLEKEHALKAEILETEKKMFESEVQADQSTLLTGLREKRAVLKRDYAALMSTIRENAPKYYKLRFDHHTTSTASVQNELLAGNEALVEFFLGDSLLAVSGITSDKTYLEVSAIDSTFKTKLLRMRALLTSASPKIQPEFLALARSLYQQLLAKCLDTLGENVHKLIISPDGLLGYIPFEILVRHDKFLNEQFSIYYTHSATYLAEQMNRKPGKTSALFGGFVASQEGGSNGWEPLTAARQEVQSIVDLLKGGSDVFDPASKADFLKHAGKYKVLHFAMHSVMNDVNPMMSGLIFSSDSTDFKLTAIELYNTPLNADLAVLSACNTGVGQMHRGEGIMSMSRAFSFAGVPSRVISLWKVPDVAASAIMINFYRHLTDGLPKDVAMQKARMDFIEAYPEMAHPYFWAGFIVQGNSAPIETENSGRWMWAGLMVILIAALWFWRRKRY